MPLYQDAKYLLRANLEAIERGERVRAVTVGELTEAQFVAINAYRSSSDLPKLENPEIVFLGKHLYKSRVTEDGYTIDDVIDQIANALAKTSVVHLNPKMSALKAAVPRADRYGNFVRDMAILELTQRKPRAELFSVIPKGDTNKPK